MTYQTISLRALRSVLSERIHDAGGPAKFARAGGNGLTSMHWSNILNGHRPFTKPALDILGYVEVPPRYMAVRKNTSK